MVKLYVLSFLAGLVAAYGVPLFINGIIGRDYQNMLGKMSAVTAVVAGWVSFAVAAILLHFSHPWTHLYRASVLFAVGALLMAVYLASRSKSAAGTKR